MINNDCADCGVNTWILREFYMVHPDLWSQYGAGDGMLCIGCLEGRMDRQLVPADFTGARINTAPEGGLWDRSERLRDRLDSKVAV